MTKESPRDVWSRRGTVGSRVRTLQVGDEVELGCHLLEVIEEEEGGNGGLIYDEGDFYEYLPWEGIWQIVDSFHLSRVIQSFSGSPVPDGRRTVPLKVSARMLEGAIKLASSRVQSPGFFATSPGGIAFKNGFVPITTEGVGALQPLSAEQRVRVVYPFDYDPKATCEDFLTFLDDLFRDDKDKAEKIACLQEFFGACRAGVVTRYQKCLFLRSPGGGGRSTLMKIIEAAFTGETISGIKPQQFPDASRRALLPGKLLNYADELPSSTILESDWFKQIVTGDWTDARALYRPAIRFRPIAGHCFLANELPPTSDLSQAFFRRILVLSFNRTFHEEKSRDLIIADKILASNLPGLVTWLLRGLDRLVKAGTYTVPPSHEIEARGWRTKSDNVSLFLEEKCVRSSSPVPGTGRDWLMTRQLFTHYREWAEATGHRYTVAENVFGTRLKALNIHGRRTKKGVFYPIRIRRAGEGLVQDFLTDLKKRPVLEVVEDVEESDEEG